MKEVVSIQHKVEKNEALVKEAEVGKKCFVVNQSHL